MEGTFNQITHYILTQSWQIALLVAVIALVNLVLRHRSAHVRYLLWLVVLAKCLVPPLLSVPLAVLPEEKSVPAPRLEGPVPPEAAPVSMSSTPVRPALPERAVASRTARLYPRQWFALAWMGGVAVFVLIAGVKALRTQFWLRRKRKPLPADLHVGIADLFSGFGLKTFPKVWLVEGIGQPFVWGLLRGGIYLPANFVKVNSPEHRRGVLGHELSHILRFDAAINFLQTIAQALFWFHPFVWWSNKRIRAEREKCCDEMAIVRLNAQVRDYSRAIVDTLVTEYESTRPIPSLAVAGPVKNIEERIRTMMKPGKKFYKRPSVVTAMTIVLISVLTVPTALVLTARAAQEVKSESEAKPTKSLHEAAANGDLEEVKLYLSKDADINVKDQRGRTALHRAANTGHAEIARMLIEHGADVNIGDNLNRTPLEHAAVAGHAEVAELLIDKGANPNARNRNGVTPFHVAAGSADINTVKLLIDKGADVTVKNDAGKTPLYDAMMSANANRRQIVDIIVATGKVPSTIYLAAYMGDLAKVKTFIGEGSDVNEKEEGVGTALHCAAAGGQKEAAQLLLAQGTDVNLKAGDGLTPLHAAVFYSDDAETVKLLISNGADVNSSASVEDDSGMSVLGLRLLRCVIQSLSKNDDEMTAKTKSLWNSDVTNVLTSNGARFGDGDKMCLSIAEKMDIPDIMKLTPTKNDDENEKQPDHSATLHQAAAEGDVEQVKKLLAAGASVNAKDSDGNTPLNRAVKAGQQAIVMLLIDKGSDVNAPGRWTARPLHEAAWEGHVELVKLLIARGADVNAWQGDYWTPLHSAADQGHKDVAEILIASGADVNLKREGGIPLHTAAGQGQLEMAALLIDKGAEVDAKDSWGGTPLMNAAENGHVALASLLIEKGANVNARNENDRTALHRAARNIRNRDIVELLIAEGADVNSKDKDGETPADFAFDSRLPYSNRIVKLLVGKGAGISKLEDIHLATYLGDLTRVNAYLKQGKDVNATNKDGKTPLHLAAMAGEREMLEFLIANGANLDMKDYGGSTALDYAQCHQHSGIARLLKAKGAVRTVPKGWHRRGSHPKDYAMTVDKSDSHSGQACAHINFTGDKAPGFGGLLQSFRADDYRGKRINMSAWMKTKEAKRAQLWMRLDGVSKTLGFDNMDDRPVRGTTDWNKYEITLDVPENTVGVYFGAFVGGTGEAWVDDFTFSVVADYIPATSKLTQEQMDAERDELERKAQRYPQQLVNLGFEDIGQ